MKRVIIKSAIVCSLSLFTKSVQGQEHSFQTSGDWSNPSNWDKGIPSATNDVRIPLLITANVDITNAVCNNLTMFLSSLNIDLGGRLTINGRFAATTTGVISNEGTLIMRGDLETALGDRILSIQGGVTTVSGLTFPNVTIK